MRRRSPKWIRAGRLSPFAREVLETIGRRRLLGRGDRVLVALSGGADSVALLGAMLELRRAGAVGEVAAAHVDHQLRADSGEDARFCRELAARLGVPIEIAAVAVAPGNVQAQARRARYRALAGVAAKVGAGRIATAHTRSDQAETFLLRALRGSGARGLSGIPPRRGAIVRPLIDQPREAVLEYLRQSCLSWREDPSNAGRKYQRNRLRHDAMPALRALAPGVERALARAADLLRADERALERAAKELLEKTSGSASAAGEREGRFAADERGKRLAAGGGETIAIASLRGQPVAVRRRAIRQLWKAATGSRRALLARHVEAVLALARRPGPGRLSLPNGWEAGVAYGQLALSGLGPRDSGLGRGRSRAASPGRGEWQLPGPGRFTCGGAVLEIGSTGEVPSSPAEDAPGPALEIDLPLDVAWPLTFRTRRPGDRFRPLGGRGEKKLKAWLIDRKFPRARRDGLWLLVSAGGEILWIPELATRGAASARGRSGWRIRLEPRLPAISEGGLQGDPPDVID
jgi:tRNA(Ile)-lysidine synthase